MIALEHSQVLGCTPHEAGRALLKQMYSRYVGGEMPPIAKGKRGKPCFEGAQIHFSITHTARHAFCALSDRPIGIDAEEQDRKVNPKLAHKILSPAEFARYEAATDKNAALLRLWVLKEADGKRTGEGINGYPNHTDFSPDDPRIQIISGCFVAVIEG